MKAIKERGRVGSWVVGGNGARDRGRNEGVGGKGQVRGNTRGRHRSNMCRNLGAKTGGDAKIIRQTRGYKSAEVNKHSVGRIVQAKQSNSKKQNKSTYLARSKNCCRQGSWRQERDRGVRSDGIAELVAKLMKRLRLSQR